NKISCSLSSFYDKLTSEIKHCIKEGSMDMISSILGILFFVNIILAFAIIFFRAAKSEYDVGLAYGFGVSSDCRIHSLPHFQSEFFPEENVLLARSGKDRY